MTSTALANPDDERGGLDELEMIERHPPLEMRSAQVLDVRHPDRTIELIAAPYDEEVPVLRRGEWITETILRGAFDGVELRANRVKVNRDHDVSRTIGRAVALYPNRDEGLVAQLRISRTPQGDEALELASDRVLDASIAFAPMRDGEQYTENRTRRQITRAFLGHIALVPDPAYEGAQVLDVRSASLRPGSALAQLAQYVTDSRSGGVAFANMIGNAEQDLGALLGTSSTPRKDEVLARLAELGYHPPLK
jgi:HK97 family phage prohead protease